MGWRTNIDLIKKRAWRRRLLWVLLIIILFADGKTCYLELDVGVGKCLAKLRLIPKPTWRKALLFTSTKDERVIEIHLKYNCWRIMASFHKDNSTILHIKPNINRKNHHVFLKFQEMWPWWRRNVGTRRRISWRKWNVFAMAWIKRSFAQGMAWMQRRFVESTKWRNKRTLL